MSKPKRYEIDSFEKLINVASTENFDFFAQDLLLWLHYSIKAIEKLRVDSPEFCKGKTNWQIVNIKFIWIDDQKTGLTTFSVKDKNTGLVTQFKANKKREK